MLRFVSTALLVAASLSLGSWVGLGMPRGVEPRAAAKQIENQLAPHVHRVWPARVTKGVETPRPIPPGDSALSPAVDLKATGGLVAFPRLNPDASLTRAWLLAEGPERPLHPTKKFVTLTFDDGPNPSTTPEILRLLEEHKMPATFFFVGRYLQGDDTRAVKSRELAQRVLAGGHAIGNHTLDHAILGRLHRKDVVREIDDSAFAIERATGRATTFFRPPYGSLDSFGEFEAKVRGLELVLWSVEVGDMRRTDVDAMVDELETQLDYAGGGTVLLHDFKPTSVRVLAKLLTWIDAHAYDDRTPEKPGFVVVDLPTYLRETERKPQPFESRRELEKARGISWKREKTRSAEAELPARDVPSARL
jgi:peptidoglycan-N-acetylglucosamine deacetylase